MLRKRYKMKRRSMRRSTRRSGIRKGFKKSTPEIKIQTDIYPSLEIMATRLNAVSASLPATGFLINDILRTIVAGTGPNQRVGSRIFVKKIQISITVYLCPEGNSVELNSALIRCVVGTAGWDKTSGTSIANFFDTPVIYPFNGPLNRRLYSYFYDKIVTMNSGWAAETDSSGTASAGLGMAKHFNVTLNVNKNIKYIPSSAVPTDEASSYSLFLFGFTPALPANFEARVACCTVRTRTWYTDD